MLETVPSTPSGRICLKCTVAIINSSNAVKCAICKRSAHIDCVFSTPPNANTINQIRNAKELINFNCADCTKLLTQNGHIIQREAQQQVAEMRAAHQTKIAEMTGVINQNLLKVKGRTKQIEDLKRKLFLIESSQSGAAKRPRIENDTNTPPRDID